MMSVHKVVYKGLSDIRSMSVQDLKEAGVHVESDLIWDKTRTGSRPKVFIADMTDRLLEIFRQEGTFTVSEVKEDSLVELQGVEPIVSGEPLDDTGSVVRDGVTGQTTAKGDPDNNADPVPVTPAGAPGSAAGSSGLGAVPNTGKSGKGSAGKGSST